MEPSPLRIDLDVGADAGEGLVDRVVDDLPEAVHEAALVGRADVHAGALAHGLEALEDLEVAGGVVAVAGGSRSGGGGHGVSISFGRERPAVGLWRAGRGSLATTADGPREARGSRRRVAHGTGYDIRTEGRRRITDT